MSIIENLENETAVVQGASPPIARRLEVERIKGRRAAIRGERISRRLLEGGEWRQAGSIDKHEAVVTRKGKRKRARKIAPHDRKKLSTKRQILVRPKSSRTSTPRFKEHVIEISERVGRVRDIDFDRGSFVAILNARSRSENEMVGRFPISLVDPADLHRLDVGMEFTLTTGQRVQQGEDGKFAKPALQTTIVIHRPLPLSSEREASARARGRAVRARLTES